MKKYYLSLSKTQLNILYCLEKDSTNEQTLFSLLKRGYCNDVRLDGNWYEVELFEELPMNINETLCIDNISEIMYNIKNMNHLGTVYTNGYKDDGEFFNIAPMFVIKG